MPAVGGRGAWRLGREVRHERVLHPEDAVAVEELVAADEDVRDQGPESVGLDHEVQVRGPHRGPARRGQQQADRAVVRYRVRRGGDTPETVAPARVGEQVAAGGDPAIVVLDVVEALPVGLPDLDQRIRDRLAEGVRDRALDPARFPGCSGCDVSAGLDLG